MGERHRCRRLQLEGLEDRVLPGFIAPLAYDVGLSPRGVAVASFTASGHRDIVTANSGSNTVSVLLGNGDGTFQDARSFAAGRGPESVAVGDFNGDGTSDLVVANAGGQIGHGQGVSVLLGNGDGTFQAARNFAAGNYPNAVAVGDFNGDGIPDLAVADSGDAFGNGQGVSVLLGNGDGTFQDARNFAIGSAPDSVAVGDFNGDGNLDIVTANFYSNDVSVVLGNGDGTFQAPRNFAVGRQPYAVVVGDFNGDGNLDIGTVNSLSNTVTVLLGNGDGTFQTTNVGGSPESVAVGDFNGDGLPDLAVANEGSNNVSILLNDGTWPASPGLRSNGGLRATLSAAPPPASSSFWSNSDPILTAASLTALLSGPATTAAASRHAASSPAVLPLLSARTRGEEASLQALDDMFADPAEGWPWASVQRGQRDLFQRMHAVPVAAGARAGGQGGQARLRGAVPASVGAEPAPVL